MIDDLPKGFRAGAAAANFKKPGRDDLGLIVSEQACVLAGMFTQNVFKAAPVLVCQEILAHCGTARRGTGQFRSGQRLHRRGRSGRLPRRASHDG